MQRRDRRRPLVLLVALSALLGLGAGSGASAQEPAAAPLGEDLFGSYSLESHGQGVQTRYEIEGLLPGGTPVLDLGLPEALARFTNGPTGYGVASLAYPGGLIVNLPSLVEVSGGGSNTPPYPIKAEAFFPTGPTDVNDSQPGGTTQHVVTGERGVDALATFPATDAPPAVKIGSVSTHSRTSIEGEQAVSRSRVVASDVAVLGGIVTFGSVTTDIVAVHDGRTGSSSGGTQTTGVRFLGLDAALTDAGLVLKEAPPATGPGAPLGGILTPIVPPAGQALSPIQAALNAALGQTQPNLDPVLAMAGVRITLAKPTAGTAATGAAQRRAAGVTIELSYKGREQQALGDLIASIPDALKPNIGPIPNPVGFLAENHLSAIALAPATVSSLATPPFPALEDPVIGPPATSDPGAFDPGSFDAGSPAFTTPLPDLPAGGAGAAAGPVDLPTTRTSSALASGVPALLVALALLAAPFFGMGSARMADNVLAEVSRSCPTGHDKLPRSRP